MKMIDDCLPDMYVKSVYDIDYKKLYDEGIRYALFDVDSTLLPFDNIDVRDEHLKLFDGIRNLGIQTALYSNGSYRRVKPVADKLNVKFVASAHKPVYKGFKVIREMFDDKCEPVNTIFVGDSLLVDMLKLFAKCLMISVSRLILFLSAIHFWLTCFLQISAG